MLEKNIENKKYLLARVMSTNNMYVLVSYTYVLTDTKHFSQCTNIGPSSIYTFTLTIAGGKRGSIFLLARSEISLPEIRITIPAYERTNSHPEGNALPRSGSLASPRRRRRWRARARRAFPTSRTCRVRTTRALHARWYSSSRGRGVARFNRLKSPLIENESIYG